MRTAERMRPLAGSPRLAERRVGARTELWTETVGDPPPVYGERWTTVGGRSYREFDPHRSKLSAAVVRGWAGPLPRPGERWLYLGAASGSTASHVADLVGPDGRVYALERSLRPFARLWALTERWPNLLPILADARDVEGYQELVPPVDGVYADIAQPDQVEIVRAARDALVGGRAGTVLLALKGSSMGRDRPPAAHAAAAEASLASSLDLAATVKLDPFHRAHFFLGGTSRGGAAAPRAAPARLTPRRGRFRAPRGR